MTTVREDTFPGSVRLGAEVALFGTWRVGTPERQRAAADAIGAAWRSRPWPNAGLRSYVILANVDGDALLHWSRWADGAAYQASLRTEQHQSWKDEVDTAVPGIERDGAASYQLYRSVESPAWPRFPGCFAVAVAEFDSPGPRRREWADAVLDAMETDPGLIAARFHLGLDGATVLNFAEWASEQDYLDTVGASGAAVPLAADAWRRAREHPGVRAVSSSYFRPLLHLTPSP